MSDEELIRRLRDAAAACPEDVFPGPTEQDREQHPDIVTRASSGMSRHLAPLLAAAADALEAGPAALPDNVRAAVEWIQGAIDRNETSDLSVRYIESRLRTVLTHLQEKPSE